MKMSDYFLLPIGCGDIMRINEYCVVEENNDGVAHFDAAEFAINNHDRLTEENTKLREQLKHSHEWLGINSGYHGSPLCVNNEQLLNQLKDQNNDK